MAEGESVADLVATLGSLDTITGKWTGDDTYLATVEWQFRQAGDVHRLR